MADGAQFSRLVVVGSSAGGIEALATLVGTLTVDFPAPLVVAQHLSPARPSGLAEILAARSALPVKTVEDRQPMEPGTVFVVPPGRHVEISDHELSLAPRAPSDGHRSQPSIDLLLTTAADIFGEGLIAVILTGTGSDGAAGARDVKAAGGTVVIQNPITAAEPEMPLSLAPSIVDVAADVEAIGPLLKDLLSGDFSPNRPEEDDQFQAFLRQLREQSGLDFAGYKTPTIMRRLKQRMASTGTADLGAYIRYLEANPAEYQRLASSFLIKVTQFFRDPELFDYLAEEALPRLIDEARPRRELRVWSAGCATGEEAYSVAILIADLLGDELEGMTVRIFATDLDADAVAFARRGVYPASAVATVSPERLARYFKPADGSYEVTKQLRSLVVFGQHDLGQRAPFPRIDLALCRNVLIYFAPELQKRTLQLFAFSLRDGGYLVLGKAETVTPLAAMFALEQLRLKVYRRVGERVLIASARIRDAIPRPLAMPVLRPSKMQTDQAAVRLQRERVTRTRPFAEQAEGLLHGFPIGIVIVDRRYDIVLINAVARHLLGIHTPAIGEDLIHLVLVQNAPLIPLRAAIDAAFRGEDARGVYPVETAETAVGETRYVEIACHPRRLAGGDGGADAVMLLVTDVSQGEQARREAVGAAQGEREARDRLEAQLARLAEANRRIVEANRELTTLNAELRAANHEFLVVNEEVQAATEEVETLNEELQATNEELETLNEEFQATIEELNTTNDDLEARSIELQDLTQTLDEQRRASEAARARLEAILVGMGDAVLVQDGDEQTVLTNAAYDAIFDGRDLATALTREDGKPLPASENPIRRAAAGESFRAEYLGAPAGEERRWFEATGAPVRVAGGVIDGGVVVIRDISERSLRRLQDRFMALASHELRTPLTALRVALQLLARQIVEDRQRRRVTVALEQAERLQSYIDDLMDVARLQTGKLNVVRVPIRLDAIVRTAVATAELLSTSQRIDLDATGAGDLSISGDARRLEQVVLNLLTNAITYAPDTERVDVRLRRDGDWAELAVRDHGPGISEADQTRVFTRFSQIERDGRRARGGLGLGLFIAKEIVTAHDGTIAITPTDGVGTTFTIRLPLLVADAALPG
jgi:two-component system CheB/CheR fusion protein